MTPHEHVCVILRLRSGQAASRQTLNAGHVPWKTSKDGPSLSLTLAVAASLSAVRTIMKELYVFVWF